MGQWRMLGIATGQGLVATPPALVARDPTTPHNKASSKAGRQVDRDTKLSNK
jgi:hypothetical protein